VNDKTLGERIVEFVYGALVLLGLVAVLYSIGQGWRPDETEREQPFYRGQN
jgi:hypothetical protein